jgi:long-subunit fatty acid transport protein
MKFKLLVASVALATAQVQAGGFENARLDTSFMYDEGNLVSFGSVRKDFTVNGSSFGTTSSLIGDRNASNLSARYEVNDQLSFGLTSYDSGAIHVNYPGKGGTGLVPSFGPTVNVTADVIALIVRYSFNENASVLAGVKNEKFAVQDADIFGVPIYVGTLTATGSTATAQTAAASRTAPIVDSGSDASPFLAVSYELPKIAARVEFLYQAKTSVSLQSTCGLSSCVTDQTTGGSPEYMTLNFQTGIMQDTLLLGSIHRGKWSKSQLSVADNEVGSLAGPTSAFKDSTEYSLGIARRINNNLAISASYNWENSSGGTTDSLFTVNNGYKGITLGARYAVENVEFSLGYNITKLGDITYASGVGTNRLEGNDVSAIGAKVTMRF